MYLWTCWIDLLIELLFDPIHWAMVVEWFYSIVPQHPLYILDCNQAVWLLSTLVSTSVDYVIASPDSAPTRQYQCRVTRVQCACYSMQSNPKKLFESSMCVFDESSVGRKKLEFDTSTQSFRSFSSNLIENLNDLPAICYEIRLVQWWWRCPYCSLWNKAL